MVCGIEREKGERAKGPAGQIGRSHCAGQQGAAVLVLPSEDGAVPRRRSRWRARPAGPRLRASASKSLEQAKRLRSESWSSRTLRDRRYAATSRNSRCCSRLQLTIRHHEFSLIEQRVYNNTPHKPP